jgi:plasmid replication initiation protein
MLGGSERTLLNLALSKYRPGRSEPIFIGDEKLLKPALRLMNVYRLRIDAIKEDEVVTSYTRWLEAVIVKGTENQEVFVTFSPRFERIWLESKKRLPEHVAKEPGNIGLRSQYSIRLYAWAKKYASVGKKRISLEDLRKVLGLESVKDAEGNVVQEAPLSLWANFRQRALDVAILEINKKTDIKKLSRVN